MMILFASPKFLSYLKYTYIYFCLHHKICILDFIENKHLLVLLPFITIILKKILEDIKKSYYGCNSTILAASLPHDVHIRAIAASLHASRGRRRENDEGGSQVIDKSAAVMLLCACSLCVLCIAIAKKLFLLHSMYYYYYSILL